MIKKTLRGFGWYYFLRYSVLFNWYDQLFNKEKILQQKRELEFYSSFLSRCKLIYDIGAHEGHKTEVFSRLAQKVIACEPDEHNLKILRMRFRTKRRIIIQNLAVSDKNGETDLYIHHPGSAVNTINPEWIGILEKDKLQRWSQIVQFSSEKQKVRTVTLDNLIIKFGKPDFIKIDVEGSELNVFKGLSQRIACLTFEVLLPEFWERSVECMKMLIEMDPKTGFNYAIDEKLQLDQFLPYDEFMRIYNKLSIPHLEIIAKTPPS